MNPETTAFIAEIQQELHQRVADAHQALEAHKPTAVHDILEAMDMMLGLIEAYKIVEPASSAPLIDLQEEIVQAEFALNEQLKKEIKPMTPGDLPAGVTARSIAHPDGPCYAFHHDALGELGRIVLIPAGATHIELRAEIHENSRGKSDRENLFREVINRIRQSLKQLEPSEGP